MSREEPFRTLIPELASLRYRWLAFSPTLERRFTSETDPFRAKRQWLEGLLGIGLYLAFGLADSLVPSGQSTLAKELRFGVVLPLALLVNAGMLIRLPRWVHETGIVVASCLAGTLEILLATSTLNGTHFGGDLAIVAVLVFTNTVMRLRSPFAVIAFCWATGAQWFLFHVDHRGALRPPALVSLMVLAIAILTLVANYSQNREARLAFLQHAEKQDMVGSLARSNEDLALAALTDNLTGLANRSALNARLVRIWSEPFLSELTCSAVMVDIDHFKQINDRYGHLYGDRVLKRVSHLLAEALRGQEDFIARFGGEEFVVILPRTPGHLALIVAERLRGLVELAGLPATRAGDPSLQGMRATISCGVATTLPSFNPDPYVLLQAADEALYRAKRDGRNLVRSGPVAEEIGSIPATIGMQVNDELRGSAGA